MLKLTSQQFAQIYETLRAAGISGGSEKRQSTRMDVQATIQIATLSGSSVSRHYRALTRDISAAGVGFLQHGSLEANTRLLIRFPSGKQELFIVCTVRFCRVLADGLFDVGVEFDSLADPATVALFHSADSAAVDRIRNSILH